MPDGSSGSLQRQLRRLYDAPRPTAEFSQRLEGELLAAHAARFGRNAGRRRAGLRPAWVGLALAGSLLAAAGAIPTGWPVVEGTLVTVELSAEATAPEIPELLAAVGQAAATDQVSVSVSRQAMGPGRVVVIVLGPHTAGDRLIERLRDQFPSLALGDAQATALVGSLRMSLAERLGRTLFRIEVAPGPRERLQQQVVQALVSGGVADAQVEVEESGSTRTLRVRMPDR